MKATLLMFLLLLLLNGADSYKLSTKVLVCPPPQTYSVSSMSFTTKYNNTSNVVVNLTQIASNFFNLMNQYQVTFPSDILINDKNQLLIIINNLQNDIEVTLTERKKHAAKNKLFSGIITVVSVGTAIVFPIVAITAAAIATVGSASFLYSVSLEHKSSDELSEMRQKIRDFKLKNGLV